MNAGLNHEADRTWSNWKEKSIVKEEALTKKDLLMNLPFWPPLSNISKPLRGIEFMFNDIGYQIPKRNGSPDTLK